MMRDTYAHRQQNPPLLESMEIVVALVLMASCWFAWYVARERFNFTNRQIAELACFLGSLSRALTWREQLAQEEPEDRVRHRLAVPQWLRRFRDALEPHIR